MSLRCGGGSISLGLGNLGFAFGPGSIFVVFRLTSWPGGTFPMILTAGASLDVGYAIYAHATDGTLNSNLNNFDGRGPVIAINKWYCGGYTKATGFVRCRFHLYDYLTQAFQHFDETAFGTQGNSSVPLTKATIGADGAGANNFTGDFCQGAVWDQVLTDAQFESLPLDLSYENWSGAIKPRGFERAIGTGSMLDHTGGGANETARASVTATPDELALVNPAPRGLTSVLEGIGA